MDGRRRCDELYRFDAGRIPDTPAVASECADHSDAAERKSAQNNSKNGKDERPRGAYGGRTSDEARDEQVSSIRDGNPRRFEMIIKTAIALTTTLSLGVA